MALQACGAGAALVSVCAGDGRDVIQVLSGELSELPVRALLVESEPELARRGEAQAVSAGVSDRVLFRCRDATRMESYQGYVPADVLVMAGVLGNVPSRAYPDLARTAATLLRRGGFLLWTQRRFSGAIDAEYREFRAALAANQFLSMFADETLAGPGGVSYLVATEQLATTPPEPAKDPLFQFSDFDPDKVRQRILDF
jgi:hypothetical protein